MDLNEKKILVTGGAGFVGSNLVMGLQATFPKAKIFVIDDFSSGHFENLAGFKGDVIADNIVSFDLDKYFPQLDVIFHEAAITDTISAREEHKKVIHDNVEGFRNILSYCLSHHTNLVYASSSAVYGNSPPPMKVGQGERPVNAYAFSKLVEDNMARKYFESFEQRALRLVSLRYFIVYGPREFHKITEKKGSLVWRLYSQMKLGQRPIVFDDGSQKRDFVYIKDVLRANLLALRAKKNGIFNVGSGQAISINETVDILNKFLGTKLEPEYQDNPYKVSYQYYTTADLEKEKELLGYHPNYTLEKGIKDYLKA